MKDSSRLIALTSRRVERSRWKGRGGGGGNSEKDEGGRRGRRDRDKGTTMEGERSDGRRQV